MDFHLNLTSETVDHASVAEFISLPPEASVRDAFQRMKEVNTGSVLICRDDKLVGIFTERDALRIMAGGVNLDEPLADHMAADPVTLSESDVVGTAITKMARGGYRRLPIVNAEGKPNGMVKTSGILHYLVQHFPTVIYNLPPMPKHATQEREGA